MVPECCSSAVRSGINHEADFMCISPCEKKRYGGFLWMSQTAEQGKLPGFPAEAMCACMCTPTLSLLLSIAFVHATRHVRSGCGMLWLFASFSGGEMLHQPAQHFANLNHWEVLTIRSCQAPSISTSHSSGHSSSPEAHPRARHEKKHRDASEPAPSL